MSVLDEIDSEILRELVLDGRISNTELASRIGLSPSACLRRVQELERSDIIQGYRAQLNQSLLGIGFVAYIMVGLSSHNKESQESFERSLQASKEVRECHNITGSFEYLLRIETESLAKYKIFHTNVLGIFTSGKLNFYICSYGILKRFTSLNRLFPLSRHDSNDLSNKR